MTVNSKHALADGMIVSAAATTFAAMAAVWRWRKARQSRRSSPARIHAKRPQQQSDNKGGDVKKEAYEVVLDDAFAWLRWSPEAQSPCGQTLARCFPGAMPGTPILLRSADVLQSLDSSINPDTVLYGQSICPDEINNEANDLATRMASHWGEVFPMGGIGGAPFVGKTGFGAFSHHVPEDGHVFILFGPHIAVSACGELGKYHRAGQKCESSACGAVLAAYNACKAGEVEPGAMDMSDMQQSWLRQKVHQHYEEIAAAEEPLQALVKKAYEEIEKTTLEIVNHGFGKGKLILLGGIQINLPKPFEDHFQPLMFRVSSKDDPEGVDLLPELYKAGGASAIRLGKMTSSPKAAQAVRST